MSLQTAGPLFRVSLMDREASNNVAGAALLDTGARQTCFDENVARTLGLPVVDEAVLRTPSGDEQLRPCFTGTLRLDGFGNLGVERAVGCSLAELGLIALIGRDALSAAVFVYNGADGSYSLSV